MILDDKKIKHIHFMGIGGIGVSALAEILFKKGYRVTGTDIVTNLNTKRLQNMGIEISLGHENTCVTQADLAVYSSAISKTNPEFIVALTAKIPLLSRGQLLAEIMLDYKAFAVSGAHGKTTTSALLAHTFLTADLDPSFMVGGVLNDTRSPARIGNGPYFIAEADESDASFLLMHPDFAIITNIDADHLETYQGDFNQLKKSYIQFVSQLREKGVAAVCSDDPVIRTLLPTLNKHCSVITYGFSPDADYQIINYSQNGLKSNFQIKRPRTNAHPVNQATPLSVELNLPGKHNAQNATAIVIASHQVNIDDALLLKALANFSGVGRRFHLHGEYKINNREALLLEDYGHHPNEIKATLYAARAAWPGRRVVLVFQPHRYTRTRDLMQEFATVLTESDLLVLLEVYAAGESPIIGADGQHLLKAVQQLRAQAAQDAVFVPALSALPAILQQYVRANDVVIFQGAGDINTVIPLVTAHAKN